MPPQKTPPGFEPVDKKALAGFAPVDNSAPPATDDTLTEPGMLDPHGKWNFGDILRGAGSGIYNMIAHPLITGAGMVQGAMASGMSPMGEGYPSTAATGRMSDLEANQQVQQQAQQGQAEQAQQMAAHPLYAAGSIAGPALLMHGLMKAPGVARNVVESGLRGGLEASTKATPRLAANLVDETLAKNAAERAKVDAANAALEAKRQEQLRQHFDKTQAAKTANEQGQAAQSRKAALNRGVEQLDTQFQDDLKGTAKKANAEGNRRYQVVREALSEHADPETGEVTPAPAAPPEALSQAVQRAEAKIQGSSENLKIFRDILSKHPDVDPDFVEYQGKQVPKTDTYEYQGKTLTRPNTLYEALKGQTGVTEAVPTTFSDLQGYYSELGDKLAGGGLQGDVYQALKSLHDDIGKTMQGMADQAGVGAELADAQKYWRGYMQAFREPSSPLYKAIKAGERGKSIAALQGKDQTGIGVLAQYDPQLAQRANTIRGYQAEARTIPARAPATKPAPTLPPAKPPVEAKITQLGPEDIRTAKAQSVQDAATAIATGRSPFVSAIAGYDIIKNLMGGKLLAASRDIVARVLYGAAKQGIAKAVADPVIAEWIARPTARDLAELERLPPEQRKALGANIGPVLKAAQAKGIPVNSRLMGLFTGIGAMNAGLPPDHPLQQSAPEQ